MSRHLPDEDLLITDPERQPGVILDVPPDVRPIGLLDTGYYADHEVRCSFCVKRTRHKKGRSPSCPTTRA